MLSSGSWISSRPLWIEDNGIASPSSVADGVIVASVATAQARSSSSLVPLPSKVLHSVVQPEKTILVPRATVQFVTPSPASGATTLPLNCTQGSPPANGLVGVGSSSTVVHRLPRSPGKSCGAALAGGQETDRKPCYRERTG